MPELYKQCLISHNFHVKNVDTGCNIITDMDIIFRLGIIYNDKQGIVGWAGGSIVLRSRNTTVKDSFSIDDPNLFQQESERIIRILDERFPPAVLDHIIDTVQRSKFLGYLCISGMTI